MIDLARLAAERAKIHPAAPVPDPVPQTPAIPDPTIVDWWRGFVRRYNMRFTLRATTYSVVFAIGLALGKGSKPVPFACPVIPKSTAHYSGDNYSAFNEDIGDANRTK